MKSTQKQIVTFNKIYFAVFIVLFIVELIIALFVRDAFIRPYLGDVLVIVLLYFFLRSFIYKNYKGYPLYLLLFGIAVEISQYFNLVSILGLEWFKPAVLLLGTTFDVQDIICYAVGALLVWICQLAEKKHTDTNN